MLGKSNGESTWKLIGRSTSRVCAAALLGVGTNRLHQAKTGLLDRRYSQYGGVSQTINILSGACVFSSLSLGMK